jgi:hypothetical protein
MSMSKVNRAFAEALKGKASVDGCTMVWERGDDGVQRQRLTCFITVGDQPRTVTGLFDGRADLVGAALKLASEFTADTKIERQRARSGMRRRLRTFGGRNERRHLPDRR